jgi:muscleblind
MLPGNMPYKRPAPDNKAFAYQPSAAAYQQLMQLQSQQPYVPVSCEYSSHPQTSASDTIFPNTSSTATLNANNHHLYLNSQTSYNNNISNINNTNNACNINLLSSNNKNKNYNENTFENNASNNFNFNTSTFFADAHQNTAQQQNSISQSSSPSKMSAVPSSMNNVNANAVVTSAVTAAATSPDDGDSENALIVQNAKSIVNATNGSDEVVSSPAATCVTTTADCNDENNKAINDDVLLSSSAAVLQNNQIHATVAAAVDDATQTSSLQSSVDESNLNANSFNSATSSSPAALAAIYTTSSITNNNNNSILSRKNSLTTPTHQSLHLMNSSKAPKVDSVPDYLSASTLNNNPQAALLSAMLYNQPYQQFQSLYSDPAQLAKEMAQKNYANALKFAVAQQNPNVAGKSPLTYSGVSLSANSNAMYTQQPGTSANRLPSPMSQAVRSPYMQAAMSRPLQNPFQQFMRPQMPVNLTAATNPYYAAAAAAQQQFLSQQNMIYSGMTNPMANAQMTATSVASSTPTQYASQSYPFALSQAQAMNAASLMQVPQMTAQQSQQPVGSNSVVLNPYKKMKTS